MPHLDMRLPYADMYCQLCESRNIIFHIVFAYSQKSEFGSKVSFMECLNCHGKIELEDSVRIKLNEICYRTE